MKLVTKKENIYDDNIGFVELWDNSEANASLDSRVETVTTVASVCFGKDKAKKPEKLFNRLESEAMGLPSSSFEFVPVLLSSLEVKFLQELSSVYYNKTGEVYTPHCLKFGEIFVTNKENAEWMVVTNLRALLYDNEAALKYMNTDISNWFNKGADFNHIRKQVKLFRIKVPIFVARQIMRHRQASWQELSRRYTSGGLEFYKHPDIDYDYGSVMDEYERLLKKGVKAEVARMILPVSLYTTIWVQFTEKGWDNFINLRIDKHTQEPTRVLAESMKTLYESQPIED